MEKLKPCPFCGKLPYLHRGFDDLWYIECNFAGCSFNPHTRGIHKEYVTDVWNKRDKTVNVEIIESLSKTVETLTVENKELQDKLSQRET